MTLYEIQDTTEFDVDYISSRMRVEDRREIFYSNGLQPHDALRLGLEHSDNVRTFKAGGEPVLIFGVKSATLWQQIGIVWALGTNAVKNHSQWFLRHSTEQVHDVSKGFQVVENWCHVDNHTSIKWLRWCGFEMDDPKSYGVYGKPFIHFHKRLV